MNFEGFKTYEDESGIIIEMVMPSVLRESFFAKLYARGALNDAAEGDPETVWKALSACYNNRPLVAPRQVHGVNIIEADGGRTLPQRPDADGVFIEDGAHPLASLRFADCTPVVIAGAAENGPGWRRCIPALREPCRISPPPP